MIKRIKNTTKEEILKNTEQVVDEMYRLAYAYINKNPIYGYDKDDYIQELVALLWSKLSYFDSTKASFTTFAYIVFSNFRNRFIENSLKNKVDLISDEDIDVIVADTGSDICTKLAIQEILANCSDELKLFLDGHTKIEIAKRFKVSNTLIATKLENELNRLKELLK